MIKHGVYLTFKDLEIVRDAIRQKERETSGDDPLLADLERILTELTTLFDRAPEWMKSK